MCAFCRAHRRFFTNCDTDPVHANPGQFGDALRRPCRCIAGRGRGNREPACLSDGRRGRGAGVHPPARRLRRFGRADRRLPDRLSCRSIHHRPPSCQNETDACCLSSFHDRRDFGLLCIRNGLVHVPDPYASAGGAGAMRPSLFAGRLSEGYRGRRSF